MNRKEIKKQSKREIHSRFWATIIAILIWMMPVTLFSAVMSGYEKTNCEISNIGIWIALFLLFFVTSFLEFGLWKYITLRADGLSSSPRIVLCCFKDWRKALLAIKLILCICVRSLGWILLVIFGILLTELFPPAVILFFVILMYVYAKIQRYIAAYIALARDSNLPVWGTVRDCATAFQGRTFELIVFDLSFLLWHLLSLITFGVVGIYVRAYTRIAFVHYFDLLCENKSTI